jgi:hypothetical protein
MDRITADGQDDGNGYDNCNGGQDDGGWTG